MAQFSTFDFPCLSQDQYERFALLLGIAISDPEVGLRQRLDNIGHLYASRLINSIYGRSRLEDRAANKNISGNASKLIQAVDALITSGIPPLCEGGVKPVPAVSHRQNWLAEVCDALLEVERSVKSSGRNEGRVSNLILSIRALRLDLAELDDDARVHLLFTLKEQQSAKHNDHCFSPLLIALQSIADAAEQAKDSWKAQRGPEPRTALAILAVDLYDAIVEARGTPLKLLIASRGEYKGRPQNDDTQFLLEFVNWIHASLPSDMRARNSHLLRSEAIFDVYKEHYALMRRNEQTSRVTR